MKKILLLLSIAIGLVLGGCASKEVRSGESSIEESAEREARPDYFELQYMDRHKDRQRHHWTD